MTNRGHRSPSDALGNERNLGHYRVVGLLGSGGMGQVYRAHDQVLGRDVALKLLPDSIAQDPETLQRFRREAKMLAVLNHPHVVTVHGFEHDDDQHFLVMELLDGRTLRDLLREGPLPVPKALEIARQLAEALDAMHEHGIVHRDIKPSNVMLTDCGTVKLFDFGLAKARVDTSIDITHQVTSDPTAQHMGIPGTIPYMSPEQVRGEGLDRRTDVWAYGCVLYEMLVGHSPFAAATGGETLAGILEHEPDWSRLPDSLPESLDRALRLSLRKDRSERLRSVHDAWTDVPAIPSAPGPPRGSAAVRRLGLALLAAAAVAFVGATVFNGSALLASLGWGGLPDPLNVAILPFQAGSDDPREAALAAGWSTSVTERISRSLARAGPWSCRVTR